MDVATLMALSMWAFPVSAEEPYLIAQAMSCPRGKEEGSRDPRLFAQMLRMEEHVGVPSSLRGMSLAAACKESGFSNHVKGDHGRAVGILQQWPWYERRYQIRRNVPSEATAAWLIHVAKQVPKVQKQCSPRGQRSLWVTAWVTAIRAPKKGGRCNQVPKHLPLLNAWRLHLKDRDT